MPRVGVAEQLVEKKTFEPDSHGQPIVRLESLTYRCAPGSRERSMREILPGRFWIGNAGDGRDSERLLGAGVVAVVNLAVEEPSPALPRSMVYCHFPLADGAQDGQGILVVAIQTVVSLLTNHVPTLVYCGAGMSRSPAVVAAALSLVHGGSPEERLREVVAGQSHDVSPQLWEAVRRVCDRWPQNK